MIAPTAFSITEPDGQLLVQWCQKYNIKTVLEFGPGYSTSFFLQAKCDVTSSECDNEWLEKYSKMPEFNSVRMIPFVFNQFPLNIPELNPGQQFDLGFIDSPTGGTFTYSRINTALFAYRMCRYIAMHDTKRDGEKMTCKILEALGCEKVDEDISGVCGISLYRVAINHD